MYNAVLFDLDGTLLPMDQDEFVSCYFMLLAKKFAPFGYDPKILTDAVWHATKAMMMNNGSRTNEEVFWADYINTFGEEARSHRSLLTDFYTNEFQQLQKKCRRHPKAREIIHYLKSADTQTVLATNPLFPSIATESRIRWAGLEPDDFEFYTSYENIGYSKPNLNYYRELLRRMNLPVKDCLMVGNDVDEDMIADQLGMNVFLLTDCLINRSESDINNFPHGSFEDLQAFLQN